MEKEIELEKIRRRMMTSLLNIEEKDRILSVLNKELSAMREEGTIKDVNARRLESTIKSHLVEHTNDDMFDKMFDVVNPGFTKRLREICPGLAESYVRLACYILMELDNKRIASLMMIRLESVHQARWRLARNLNLQSGESLDAYLRNLNDSQERR